MQRRDQRVKLFAALVHRGHLRPQRLAHAAEIDPARREVRRDLERPERPTHITIDRDRQGIERLAIGLDSGQAARIVEGQLEQGTNLWAGNRLEFENPGPRAQRRIDLKAGILGGRTDQNQQSSLDVRQ